jgi:tRNA 2-thiouridine synthesizing protein E
MNRPGLTTDADGFLRDAADWSPALARTLAVREGLAPLSRSRWRAVEFVRAFHEATGREPPAVRIGRALQMGPDELGTLFPEGIARGAYRLAGLPRPKGGL